MNLVGIVIDKYTTGFSKRFEGGICLTLSRRLWQTKGLYTRKGKTANTGRMQSKQLRTNSKVASHLSPGDSLGVLRTLQYVIYFREEWWWGWGGGGGAGLIEDLQYN